MSWENNIEVLYYRPIYYVYNIKGKCIFTSLYLPNIKAYLKEYKGKKLVVKKEMEYI